MTYTVDKRPPTADGIHFRDRFNNRVSPTTYLLARFVRGFDFMAPFI